MSDGSFRFVYQGCTHGRAPPSEQLHRAETILSGFIVSPYESDDGEQKGLKLFGYSHINYKSSPALALLREFVKKAPLKWFTALINEAQRWQLKSDEEPAHNAIQQITYNL